MVGKQGNINASLSLVLLPFGQSEALYSAVKMGKSFFIIPKGKNEILHRACLY